MKESREDEGADGDESEDEDGESNGSDGLCDGKGGGKTNNLNTGKDPDGGVTLDGLQLGSRGCKGLVAGEEHDLGGDTVALEGLYTHDEEESCKDAMGNEVQDDQKRACHGAEGEEALGEVGDALFDDVGDLKGVAAFILALLVELLDGLGDAEGLGVERSLGDETIGEWQAEDAGDTGGAAKEEQVPVEASRFAKRELGALSNEGGDYKNSLARGKAWETKEGEGGLTVVIKPEEDREEDCERKGSEDLPNA